MQLLACPSYHEVLLSGIGIIRSGKDGVLSFRIVAPIGSSLPKALTGTEFPGEIAADNEHVMLKAIDESGREWRSNWFITIARVNFLGQRVYVEHPLQQIGYTNSRTSHAQSTSRILIPRPPELPYDTFTQRKTTVGEKFLEESHSLDHHSMSIGGAMVAFRKHGTDWLSIDTVKQQPIMPTWPGFVCHALEVATAQSLRPVVTTREFNDRKDVMVHSGPYWRYSRPMPAPVYYDNSPAYGKDFWGFLTAFVLHLESLKDYKHLERLLDEIEGVRSGSQGSLQTRCLTLSVGIESIAAILLPDVEITGVAAEDLDSLKKHLGEWKGDGKIKERTLGAIARLREASAADKLYHWAEKSGVSKLLIDKWKSLRHRVAHGAKLEESQEILNCYHCSVELYYRLIAAVIGYTGPILQTSRLDWGLMDEQSDGEAQS